MQWCWCSDGASHAISLDGSSSLKTGRSAAGVSQLHHQPSSDSGSTTNSGRQVSERLSKVHLTTPENGLNVVNHRQIDGNASEPSGSFVTVSQPQHQPQSSPSPISTGSKQATVPTIGAPPHPNPSPSPPSPQPSKDPHPSPKPSPPKPSPHSTTPPRPRTSTSNPSLDIPPHHHPPSGPPLSRRPTITRANMTPSQKAELDRAEWEAVDAAVQAQRECPVFWRRVLGRRGWGCCCSGNGKEEGEG